jgi:cytochrome c
MHYSFLEKFGASILIVMWMLWGGDKIGDFLVHAEPSAQRGSLAEGADATATAAKPAEPEKPFPELLASADAAAGARAYKKCATCHTDDKGGANKIGPNLWDIVGKDIGSHEGFQYSGALQGLDGAWDYEKLNEFLLKPSAFAKGTKMTFAGIRDSAERAAVINYLRTKSDSPKPLP